MPVGGKTMVRISLFASVLLLAACVSAGEVGAASGPDCFRSASVSGFNVIDRTTIEVRVGASRRYLLTTNWPTSNLNFSEHIVLRSATGRICTGNGLGVEIAGGEPVTQYPIQAIARAPAPASASQN
jgi:hypothetical protein